MTSAFNAARYAAVCAILAIPDEPQMVRGHRLTRLGDPQRRRTVFLPLLVRWAQRRYLAGDPEPVLGQAKRSGAVPCGRVLGFDQVRHRMGQ